MIVSDRPARRPSLAEFVEAHPAMRLVVTSGRTQTRSALMKSRERGSTRAGIWCNGGEGLRLHMYPRKAPSNRPIKTRRGDFMLYSYSSGAVDMLPGMVQPGMPWSKNKAKIQNNQISEVALILHGPVRIAKPPVRD